MPTIVAAGSKSITLTKGSERLSVTAREIWAAFQNRSTTVQCIRCYERGGQCTRNYAAGCKGHI